MTGQPNDTDTDAAPSLVARVRRIAATATAHNYGQTIWEADEHAPGEVWLRMSSWPRAQEAWRALEAAGFVVRGRDDSPNSLMVSESSR